jgi:hypothetical protein
MRPQTSEDPVQPSEAGMANAEKRKSMFGLF